MAGFARNYGAGPLHLLAALASFAVAGYAALRIRDLGAAGNVAVWFVGVVVVHDLLLLPLYSLVESIASRCTRATAKPARTGAPQPPGVLLLNHVRVPAMISGLLFLLYFPSILSRNDGYVGASGLGSGVYLGRWLALTGALFVLSGLLYAVRRGRSRAAYPAVQR